MLEKYQSTKWLVGNATHPSMMIIDWLTWDSMTFIWWYRIKWTHVGFCMTGTTSISLLDPTCNLYVDSNLSLAFFGSLSVVLDHQQLRVILSTLTSCVSTWSRHKLSRENGMIEWLTIDGTPNKLYLFPEFCVGKSGIKHWRHPRFQSEIIWPFRFFDFQAYCSFPKLMLPRQRVQENKDPCCMRILPQMGSYNLIKVRTWHIFRQ